MDFFFNFLTSRKEFNVDTRIFIRPDSEFIRESVCACAKLIVDEEAHGTLNRIVELNKTLTDSIRKQHKKEDSALYKN
jgi:hypothetical protein